MDLFALFHAAERHKCDEFNLVLQSVMIDSHVAEYEGRYYLLVDEKLSEKAYTQLKYYVDENAPRAIIAQPLLAFSKGYIGAYSYAILLLVIGLFQNTQAFGLDWQAAGLADSLKIEYGQWWRSITALTLHADIAHLAGNIGFGVLFGLLVSQHIGSAAAWLSIVLSGAAGNALNAYWHQSLHTSLGASTMVFAALGMLGVFALNSKKRYKRKSMRHWLPFVSTAALLALTGTAGEKTDVLAHLSGYMCGVGSGILWLGFGKPQLVARKAQISMALSSIFIVSLAWVMAFTLR